MTKSSISLKLLAGACAAGVMALSAPAQAQNLGDSLFDGACVGLKNKFDIGGGSGVEGEVMRRTIGFGRGVLEKRSVICSIDDPGVMLAATTDFINRTALHAAEGMSSVEKALNLENKSAAYVAQLEAALQGGDPQQQIDQDRLNATQKLGERAKEIRAELDKQEQSGYLTPEQRELVVAAQGELSRASYFLSQSFTGASSFGLMFSRMSTEEKLRFSMPGSMEEKAVSESFLASAPARIADMGNNLRSVVDLGGKVEDSLSPDEIEELRKKIKGERKKSEKQAKKDAKSVAEKFEGQIDDGPF